LNIQFEGFGLNICISEYQIQSFHKSGLIQGRFSLHFDTIRCEKLLLINTIVNAHLSDRMRSYFIPMVEITHSVMQYAGKGFVLGFMTTSFF